MKRRCGKEEGGEVEGERGGKEGGGGEGRSENGEKEMKMIMKGNMKERRSLVVLLFLPSLPPPRFFSTSSSPPLPRPPPPQLPPNQNENQSEKDSLRVAEGDGRFPWHQKDNNERSSDDVSLPEQTGKLTEAPAPHLIPSALHK